MGKYDGSLFNLSTPYNFRYLPTKYINISDVTE